MKYCDIIKMDLTLDEIFEAVKHARSQTFIDNLRERNEFVALDSKIRGYMGEIYLKKLFFLNNITVLRASHKDDGLGVDVDMEVETSGGKSLIVECKTSLVPDCYKTIQNCISRCDIKIIKRENNFTSIPVDIHIQIYFDQCRKIRDTELCQIPGHVSDYSDEQIIELFNLEELDGFFVAWMDKNSLNSYLSSFIEYRERIWSFGYRTFWKCPLYMSYAPKELFQYLKDN